MSASVLRWDDHLGQRDTKDPTLLATVTLILEDRQGAQLHAAIIQARACEGLTEGRGWGGEEGSVDFMNICETTARLGHCSSASSLGR